MKKTWLTDIIGTEKAAIGLVHLLALPGDPLYDEEGGMEKVYQAALADVIALQNGGIDALLFSNEFSFPYQSKVDTEVIASMAMLIGRLKKDITIPYGANVISDPMASIQLCTAIGGKFTRGTFSGAYSTNMGLVNVEASQFLRKRHQLNMNDLKIVHYVQPESSKDIGGRDPMVAAKMAAFSNLPDAFGVSGSLAGTKADVGLLQELREEMPDMVLFATTGVSVDSIEEIYSLADAAFVATSLKKDRVFENPVDENRVKEFMTKLNDYRG